MRRGGKAGAIAGLAALGGILWLAGPGCEVAETSLRTMVMVPASTNLTTEGATVVFRLAMEGGLDGVDVADTNATIVAAAPPVMLPISWSVSDPALGTIRANGDGLTAIYERKGSSLGNNYIYARDQARRYEAIGTVSQTEPP